VKKSSFSSSTTLVTLLAAVSAATVPACRREGKDMAGATPAKPLVMTPMPAGDAGPAADAAVDAAPKAPTDPTLRVVAEADLGGSLTAVTADDRLIVASGTFLYEAKADGSLALLGAPESYAPLFPGSEETVIGYVSNARPFRILGAGRGLDVKLTGDEGAAFHVEDGALTMLDAKTFAKDAPEPEVPVEGVADGTKCSRLPSFDGHTYARCRAKVAKKTKLSFHVKDAAGAWKAAFANAADVADTGTVGDDGALYVATAKGDAVVRCVDGAEPATACETLAIDTKLEASATPSYNLSYTDTMNAQESRYWATLRVAAPAVPKGPLSIDRVVARSRTDLWVAATMPAVGTRVLLHSGALGGKDRVRLPSDLDGRVLARNTKAPSPWVGHCDQVFVKVVAAKGDAAIDTTALKARAEEMKKLVAVRTEDEYFTPYGSAMVEGRLYDEHVAGLVVYRADVEASMDRMERIVEKMVDKLATNPMSRPTAYCTLPVLSAIVAE